VAHWAVPYTLKNIGHVFTSWHDVHVADDGIVIPAMLFGSSWWLNFN